LTLPKGDKGDQGVQGVPGGPVPAGGQAGKVLGYQTGYGSTWQDPAADLGLQTHAGLDSSMASLVTTPGTATGGALNTTFLPNKIPTYAGSRAGYYDVSKNLYNWKASNTRHWRNALATARAGTGYARLNCYGDSITQGSTSTPAPVWANSWPTRLRTKLDNTFGAAGTGVIHLPADGDDTRVVLNANGGQAWNTYDGFSPYATWGIYSPTNTTGASITVGPVQCDSFTVHTFGTTGAGPLGISIDGGAVTNYPNTRTPNGPLAITVPAGALGMHTIKIQVVAGGFIIVHGVEATIGSAGVRTTNWGCSSARADWLVAGSTGADGSTTSGSLPFSFDLFPPDLSIIAFGVNEYLQHTPVATYKANVQTIITKAKTFGDVLLLTGVPNQSTTGVPSQGDLAAALYDLADTNDVPVLDIGDRMVSYAASAALMNPPTHPNTAGYWDIADAVYQAISPAV
jgi:lysophospholipase L1-like esterase